MFIFACPACPVAPADGTGVAPADGTGVAPADDTGACPVKFCLAGWSADLTTSGKIPFQSTLFRPSNTRRHSSSAIHISSLLAMSSNIV